MHLTIVIYEQDTLANLSNCCLYVNHIGLKNPVNVQIREE